MKSPSTRQYNSRFAIPFCALVLCCAACEEDTRARDGGASNDAGEPTFDLFEVLADPYAPARRQPGTAHLASSRQVEPQAGYGNTDWTDLDRISGDTAVLLDADGPGVMTRLWFTLRDSENGSSSVLFENDVFLRFEIDDALVSIGGATSVSLVELTSGAIEDFPSPWVAGCEVASGGFVVGIPIHFQRTARVILEDNPKVDVYFQIDWRRLPNDAVVRGFDGFLSSAERAWLDAATALWVDKEERGEFETNHAQTVAPGAALTIDVDAPAVIRRISFPRLGELEGTLVVDGDTVLEDDPAHWVGDVPPAAPPYESALAAVSDTERHFDLPIPVRERATLTIVNAAATSRDVAVGLRYDSVDLDSRYGALRVDCFDVRGESESTNVVLGSLAGPGQYVGQFLIMRADMWGYTMLEGDHEVSVDGNYDLLGTGVEDFFAGAHYFILGPFALPVAGMTGADESDANRPRVAMYRHFLADSIPFESELRFEYEVFSPGTQYEGCHEWYAF